MKTLEDVFPTYEDFKACTTVKKVNKELEQVGQKAKTLELVQKKGSDYVYVLIHNVTYVRTFKFGSKELYEFLASDKINLIGRISEYEQTVCGNRLEPAFEDSGLFFSGKIKSKPVARVTTLDVTKYRDLLIALHDKPTTIKYLLTEYAKHKPDTILNFNSLKLTKSIITIKETGVPEIQVDANTGKRIRSSLK